MQPRALRPQGRCQLCLEHRARPALRNWRQTPQVKGSVPQGGPCLGGQSPGQAMMGVSACNQMPAAPCRHWGSVALLEQLPAQEPSGSSVGCWFIAEDIQGDESVAR